MRDFKDLKIAVAGTGYVGLSLSVLLAQHNQVMAVDIVQAKVDMINNHKSPIQDDYIEKYLAEKELNLTATLDAKAAYSDADFVVIAAPTNVYSTNRIDVDKENEATTTQYIPRETLRRVSTPQAYKFDLLDRKYHEAFEKEIGIYGSSYTNTMMVELGERLYFAAGSDKNIKLTTKDDLEMFKAYLKADKDSWLK